MAKRGVKRRYLETLVVLVVAVAAGVYLYATRPATDASSQSLSALPKSDVNRITADGPSGSYTLEKDGDKWFVVGDRRFEADQTVVDDMLNKLSSLEIIRSVTESPSDSDRSIYGLSAPRLTVTASIGTADVSLRFGDKTYTGGGVYVQSSTKDGVYTVLDSDFSTFAKGMNDVRNKSVVPLVSADTVELTVTNPSGSIKLVKNGGNWKIQEPYTDRADFYSVSDVLWALSDLKADEFTDDNPKDLAAYGLDKPRVTAYARMETTDADTGQSETSAITFYVGSAGADGTGFYFMTDRSPSVYYSKQSTVPLLDTTARSLLDKHAVEGTRSEYKSVTINHAGTTLKLWVDGDTWKMQSRSDQATTLNDNQINSIWFRIKDVAFDDMANATAQGAEDSKLGIDASKEAILLEKADGSKVQILLGAASGTTDKVYMKISSRDHVYLADKNTLGDLISGIESAVASMANSSSSD